MRAIRFPRDVEGAREGVDGRIVASAAVGRIGLRQGLDRKAER